MSPLSAFNSGIMFCKNTDEVKDHLDLIYNLAESHPETEKFYQQPMWEQSGMDYFHHKVNPNFYTIVPMYPIQGFVGNEVGGWFPGLFTAHVPGRGTDTRIHQLKGLAGINKWD